jgi:hypothetical protein
MDTRVKLAYDGVAVNASLIIFAKMAGSIAAAGRETADGVVKSASSWKSAWRHA